MSCGDKDMTCPAPGRFTKSQGRLRAARDAKKEKTRGSYRRVSGAGFRCRGWRLGLVRRDAHRFNLEALVHVESLFAIETFHKLARSLSNRARNTRRIDLDGAAFGTSFAIFIAQCNVIRIHFVSLLRFDDSYSPEGMVMASMLFPEPEKTLNPAPLAQGGDCVRRW